MGMTATGREMMDPAMMDPQNPMCSGPDKDMMVAQGAMFRR